MTVGPSFSPDGSRLAAVVARRRPGPRHRRRHRRRRRRDRGRGARRAPTSAPTGSGSRSDRYRRADRHRGRRRLGRAAVHARAGTTPGPATSGGARTAGGSPPPGSDATARIWDADTGEHRFTITGHTALVEQLDWSPDGTRLATASDDGTALISEITDGGVRELFSFSAQDTSRGLNGVAFSPDGERLMTGDRAITAVKIWDASTTGGAEWVNVPGQPSGGCPYSAADFTADSRGLVVSSGDGAHVDRGHRDRGATRATIGPRAADDDGDVGWLDLSDDGQLLATTGWRGPVDVWDASTGEHRFAVPSSPPTTEWVSGTWSGALTATAGHRSSYGDERGEVVIVDRSGAEVARLREEPGQRRRVRELQSRRPPAGDDT